MQVDRKHISKLLNSQVSAMFASWREANIPMQALDSIIANDKEGFAHAVSYLKQSDMTDSERALRANLMSWAISTIGLAAELGMVLEKNETEQGELPKFNKDAA